jgi:hypothetical protein
MRADIHDGLGANHSLQRAEYRCARPIISRSSHPACTARPVHTQIHGAGSEAAFAILEDVSSKPHGAERTGSRSEEPDQPAPDQPAELVHRAEDSADSLLQANRIRFATGTTRISASSEARDRKTPISPHQISLQSSHIEPKIQPIRCLRPMILGLRQGQLW